MSCAGEQGGQEGIADLPVLFSGTVPCPTCDGIDLSIVLWPDSTFYYRQAYLGAPYRKTWYDMGKWNVKAGRLQLEGNSVHLFSVRDATTIRKLNLAGKEPDQPERYDLSRAGDFVPFEISGEIAGMYSYMADAGVLAECRTGKRIPVASAGDNAALERAYLEARITPGEPLYVRIDGRLTREPATGESTIRESIIVDRFIEVRKDRSCADR
jgi:copper homeostasis protein (lipoprotein)